MRRDWCNRFDLAVGLNWMQRNQAAAGIWLEEEADRNRKQDAVEDKVEGEASRPGLAAERSS